MECAIMGIHFVTGEERGMFSLGVAASRKKAARTTRSISRWLTAPCFVWAAGCVVLPMLMVIFYAFTNQEGQFTLENITAITDPVHGVALLDSVVIALQSTAICLVLAYPLAYILSKHTKNSNSVLIMLMILPMWINFLLRIMALQMIFSNNGLLNAVLSFFHLPLQHIMYTRTAILIGMVYDYFPFMVLPIYNIMCKIDPFVIEAAADLGANSAKTFQKVILPLSMPGVISGIIMVFIPSISEFVIADILGWSKLLLIGNVIEQEFSISSNWQLGSGLSMVLMLFILISMAVMNRLNRNSSEGVGLW